MPSGVETAGEQGRHVTEAIVRTSNGLQFGSVGVVIHDGRLVQVARTERMRVQEPATR